MGARTDRLSVLCNHDRVPDWTYHPLSPLAQALLGVSRSRRAAIRVLAAVIAVPGGRAVASFFLGRFRVPDGVRVGAVVPVGHARHALRVLPALGASVVEVGPVGVDDLPVVLAVLEAEAEAGGVRPAVGRSEVIIRTADPEVAAALTMAAGTVRVVGTVRVAGTVRVVSTVQVVGVPVVAATEPELLPIADPQISSAAEALAAPGVTVLATTDVLVTAGPAWFRRVLEAATPTAPPQRWRDVPRDPRRWPSWVWGVLVGLGMVGAGLGAAVITLGPLLLWYDRDYLGLTRQGLGHIDHNLVHFLQHDRLTLAGTMVSIGILYAGLAWGGIRRGWLWARDAYLISGVVGFPTLFYFLSTGFVEPLHIAVAVVLFPLFLLAVWRSPATPRWTIRPDGPENLRRRALTGQLLMIATGLGLLVGGFTVSFVGLTGVFVPTDLEFLDTDTAHLQDANPHLVPFIAHDRAGFGGALMSAAIAIILLSLWGWRRGEAWVWWTLFLAAIAGFAPTLVIHFRIHYTDLSHLAPVYVGVVFTAIALVLARPYLCDTPRAEERQRDRAFMRSDPETIQDSSGVV